MQTALMHARRPRALFAATGLRRAAAFALVIAGIPLTFLGMLPGTVVTIATLVLPTDWDGTDVPRARPLASRARLPARQRHDD